MDYCRSVIARALRVATHFESFARYMGNSNIPARRLERRWAPRYDFHADVEIEWGSAVLHANTRDISANGMFIESSDPLWIGAGFTANLRLAQPVRLDCSVKRIEPGRGMGVSLSVPKPQLETFQQLIATLSRSCASC